MMSKGVSNAIKIKVASFSTIVKKPSLIKKLRELTLYYKSGMNYELDSFMEILKTRAPKVKILTAYKGRKLVGWALVSKEPSDFYFPNRDGYQPDLGTLFQVFVDNDFRKQGIATNLLKVAQKIAKDDYLCICPHDYTSRKFFDNFKDFKTKSL